MDWPVLVMRVVWHLSMTQKAFKYRHEVYLLNKIKSLREINKSMLTGLRLLLSSSAHSYHRQGHDLSR